jgi:oligoribonuclease NrnB/cAMP/cGMP phosphodiesterase (DHH superfamily)
MKHVFYHSDMDGIATLYSWSEFNALDGCGIATINYGAATLKAIEHVCAGDDVVFLDFCPDQMATQKLKDVGVVGVEVWDHHKGAESNIAKIRELFPDAEINYRPEGLGACAMPWERANRIPPTVVRLIAKRDVWDWSEPAAAFLHEWCTVLGPMIEDYDEWLKTFGRLEAAYDFVREVLEIGQKLVDKRDMVIAKQVSEAMKIGTLLAVNSSENISELGNALAKANEHKVGLVWSVVGKVVRMSFRSIPGAQHTALTVARIFGGGGHEHAAGASMSVQDFFSGMLGCE